MKFFTFSISTVTRRLYAFGRSAGLTEDEVRRTVNIFVINRPNPQMEAMIALRRPPRRLQRRVSVDQRNVVRNVVQNVPKRRHSISAVIAPQIPAATVVPLNRAQILVELGMERLLYLDDSEEVSSSLF